MLSHMLQTPERTRQFFLIFNETESWSEQHHDVRPDLTNLY